jgi:hypothetical protein
VVRVCVGVDLRERQRAQTKLPVHTHLARHSRDDRLLRDAPWQP